MTTSKPKMRGLEWSACIICTSSKPFWASKQSSRQFLNFKFSETMNTINKIELLELSEVQQAFNELVSVADLSHFLEGLNQIAWYLTQQDVPAIAHNSLYPIISFFIELEKAERKTWKEMYHESNPYNGIPRESTQAFTVHHSTLAEGTPQTSKGE
jgi:hypothetical protein